MPYALTIALSWPVIEITGWYQKCVENALEPLAGRSLQGAGQLTEKQGGFLDVDLRINP